MERIKVGLFIDTFYPMIDGVINVVDNYAKRLNKFCDVVVFCPGALDKKYKDELEYKVERSRRIKFFSYDYAIPVPSIDKKFKKYLKDAKLDIVHIHSPFGIGKIGVKYAKKHNIPCIGHLHSQYKVDYLKATHNSKVLTRMLLNISMKTFSDCDVCWAVNDGIGKLFKEDYGVKSKIVVQQSGTDLLPITDIEQNNKVVNEKYGIKEDEKVFIFVGRLTYLKNLMFIANALKMVKEKGIKFKMLFVGGGFDAESFEKDIINMGLGDQVIFTGRVTSKEELASLYCRSDLLLFPSYYDTDGLVKYEGASQHTPTVSVKGFYSSSNLKDNENAFLSENTVESYADKIYEACTNAELYEKISNNAYRDLYITWDDCVKKAYNDYLTLIEEKKNKKED